MVFSLKKKNKKFGKNNNKKQRNYSDSNYIILGLIVEKASKRKL